MTDWLQRHITGSFLTSTLPHLHSLVPSTCYNYPPKQSNTSQTPCVNRSTKNQGRERLTTKSITPNYSRSRQRLAQCLYTTPSLHPWRKSLPTITKCASTRFLSPAWWKSGAWSLAGPKGAYKTPRRRQPRSLQRHGPIKFPGYALIDFGRPRFPGKDAPERSKGRNCVGSLST